MPWLVRYRSHNPSAKPQFLSDPDLCDDGVGDRAHWTYRAFARVFDTKDDALNTAAVVAVRSAVHLDIVDQAAALLDPRHEPSST